MSKFRQYLNAGTQEAGYNISWGSIFAGVVTFIALLFTLSTIGTAIGFGTLDFTSSNPFSGVGIGVTIWTIITFLLAFAGAGFISGLAARRIGVLHGFLTWATSLIVVMLGASYIASGVFSFAGSAIGFTARQAGNVAQAGGNAASAVVQNIDLGINFDQIGQALDGVDTQAINQETQQLLRDTEIEELQPEYIEGQFEGARQEVVAAGEQILSNPTEAEAILSGLVDSLQARAENFSSVLEDEEAIVNALENNTQMTHQEAQQATQQAIAQAQEIAQQAEQTLNNAQTQIENAQADIQQRVDEAIQTAQQTADDASNAVAKTSIWTFIGLVLSAVVAVFSGLAGTALLNGKK